MNISTEQVRKTRVTLRKTGGVLIVGKNSLAKLAIKILSSKDSSNEIYAKYQKKYNHKPLLKNLLPKIEGKIAFVFSETNYVELKPVIEAETIKMPARAGAIAPCDIWLQPGPTFQDPGKIGEFHNLNIQVKAVKGSLEITQKYLLCEKGELVTETHAYMCKMLKIIPFEYAMDLIFVYNKGLTINQDIIRITDEDLQNGVKDTVRNLTCISLGAFIPNKLATPHTLSNAFRNLLCIGLASDYKFK